MRRMRYVDTSVEPIDEIKCFLLERRRTQRQLAMVAPVVDTKPLKDYAVPSEEELHCSIVHPPIGANNFKFKPSLSGMVQQKQFSGLPLEKPNIHLSIFVNNCGTVKANCFD